jgi:YHS domain-containing protein
MNCENVVGLGEADPSAGYALELPHLLAALTLLALSTGASFAKPVNENCAVNPSKPAKANVTVKYKGKEVGFCCNNCKAKFEADPEKFAANIEK